MKTQYKKLEKKVGEKKSTISIIICLLFLILTFLF